LRLILPVAQALCGVLVWLNVLFRRLTLRSATTLAAAQPKPPVGPRLLARHSGARSIAPHSGRYTQRTRPCFQIFCFCPKGTVEISQLRSGWFCHQNTFRPERTTEISTPQFHPDKSFVLSGRGNLGALVSSHCVAGYFLVVPSAQICGLFYFIPIIFWHATAIALNAGNK
jgi:hypothetical protein